MLASSMAAVEGRLSFDVELRVGEVVNPKRDQHGSVGERERDIVHVIPHQISSIWFRRFVRARAGVIIPAVTH
jgi:hypothetical protein